MLLREETISSSTHLFALPEYGYSVVYLYVFTEQSVNLEYIVRVGPIFLLQTNTNLSLNVNKKSIHENLKI